jgi:uncharacterized protein YggE
MENHQVEKIIDATYRVRTAAWFALLMLGIFLVFAAAGEIKGLRYIGSGIAPSDTITVSGEGDVLAIPDTAEFSFTVQNTAADVATAQAAAAKSENAIVAYLKTQGIAETDIQTTDYEVNPQYEYQQTACPNVLVSGGVSGSGIYCPPSKQILTGYQVSESVSVKVHDTTKAGALLSGIGGKGASQVSGLSFTSSDQDTLQDQARDKAIADAKTQAQTLAKSLGVSLVRIVSFNENGTSPMPYYAKASGMALDSAAAPSPQIPTGQNKITSNVTITYEIQ